MNDGYVSITSDLDSGQTVVFDAPHSEAEDETEEVTAYEILSSAAGA